MKKLYKYIVLVIGIVALSSCVDDNDVFNVGEGNDVVLKLNVKTQENKEVVLGRSSEIENPENNLYDLHFYVFNAQGNLTGYTQLTKAATTTGTVTIPTKTGTSYVYAVANIDNLSTYLLDEEDKNLLKVTDVESSTLTRDYFLTIKYKRRPPTENQELSPSPIPPIFMMSGYLNEGNAVTINSGGNIDGDMDKTIYLYRVLAKNTFNIDLDNSPGFTPKSYKLRNIPLQGMLVRNAEYIAEDTDGYYDYEEALDKEQFEFYCPENKRGTVSGITVWKNREANSYYDTDEEDNLVYTGEKKFTNAPANSTYVEIHGDYYNKTTTTSSTTPATTTTTTTSADVSYSIHLGNFDLNHGGSYGDYNVIRNYHYDYKVTVNGVEDIIAEARINNPIDNPYAEGLVIRTTTGQHYDVDAHYEARVMTFDMGDIWTLKDKGKGYILNIETPFGKTIDPLYVKYNDGIKIYCSSDNNTAYTIDKVASLFNGEADYDWIKFVKNTTNNKISSISNSNINKYPCRYPGDQWNKTVHSASSADDKPDQPWLNVFELLAELHNNASATNKENVYYTCFIDENYYEHMPWAAYVNQEPRKMHIANNLYVSHDKNSIFADVQYSISQRSIATFYTNTSVMAYGTEIIDEEDKYNSRLVQEGTSSTDVNKYYEIYEPQNQHAWNGYTSAVATNIGVQSNLNLVWYNEDSKNVEVANIEGIQPLYKAAAKACMSRNRDLSGNGYIDGDEVRWYLASVGQYHGLFLGKNSLHVDSWLITQTEMEAIQKEYDRNNKNWPSQNDGGSGHHYRGMYHYYTSSIKNVAGTYWPEEGITNNPVRYDWTSRAELVRCVRTLENNGLGIDNPEKYYTYSNNVFNLNGIKTYRDRIVDGVLPNHNQLDPQANELYKRFEVASSSLTLTLSEDLNLNTITGQAYDHCSTLTEDGGGWRTPNQKELALMLLENEDEYARSGRRIWDLNDHTTRTRFSGYQQWHTRVGYVISSNSTFNLVESNNSGTLKIRCVRDVAPEKVTNVSLSPAPVELGTDKTVTLTFIINDEGTLTINAQGLTGASSETGTIIDNGDGTISYTTISSDMQTITFKTTDAVRDGTVTISRGDIVQFELTYGRNWGTKNVSNGSRNSGNYDIKVGTTTIGSCYYEYHRNNSILNNISFSATYDGTLDNNTSITITNGNKTISTTIGNLIGGTDLRFN